MEVAERGLVADGGRTADEGREFTTERETCLFDKDKFFWLIEPAPDDDGASDAMAGISISVPMAAMVVITSSSCLGDARDNMTLAVFSADDNDMYIYLEFNLSICCTG